MLSLALQRFAYSHQGSLSARPLVSALCPHSLRRRQPRLLALPPVPAASFHLPQMRVCIVTKRLHRFGLFFFSTTSPLPSVSSRVPTPTHTRSLLPLTKSLPTNVPSIGSRNQRERTRGRKTLCGEGGEEDTLMTMVMLVAENEPKKNHRPPVGLRYFLPLCRWFMVHLVRLAMYFAYG